MDAVKIYEEAARKVGRGEINLKEFWKLIKPLRDVEVVRHGRWEWDGEAFVCSACGSGYEGQPTMMGKPMFEFCPVCGADMRKDGEAHD